MKKKVIYAVLLGCCVLGLSACGKSEAEQAAEYYQEELGLDEDDAKELADAFYDDGEDTDVSEEAEVVTKIDAVEEILAAERYTNKVQIGSTIYEFPITVGELIQSGELSILPTESNSSLTESTLVSPENEEKFILSGPGVDIRLSANNNTDAITELKNCVVEEPSILGCENIVFSGGLRLGMSLSELTELYGEPDYFNTDKDLYFYYEDMYYYDKDYETMTGYSYKIQLDMNNGCVGYIDYKIGNDKTRNEELVEYLLPGDGYNLLCHVPEDLTFLSQLNWGDIIPKSHRVIEADEKTYILSLHSETYLPANLPNFVSEVTVDSLANYYENEVYCVTNDEGAVIVITLDEKDDYGRYSVDYHGYYYVDNYCARFDMSIESGTKDDSDPISETAKQQAYDILLEILNKGIAVQ